MDEGVIYQDLKKRKNLISKLRHNVLSLGESFSSLDEENELCISYVIHGEKLALACENLEKALYGSVTSSR